ncbi:MAG: MHYT domain-containing protein [Longimicrobiales bacterium]
MDPTYNPVLVVLSVLIASLAGYTALDLGRRVTVARGGAWAAWLGGGAFALGTGIWSMHFIGMLAFRLPVPISYDVALLLLSILVAIFASAFALLVSSRSHGARPLLVAAPIMGVAIAGMHYIGMAAMRMHAVIEWDLLLVGASIAIAVTASGAALWLTFRLRSEAGRYGLRIGAAVLMGVAIAGMHYTGMAAASFSSMLSPSPMTRGAVIPSSGLAVGIVAFTLILSGMALVVSMIDQKLAISTALASENERLYRAAQAEIAERQRAEQALHASEERLRQAQRLEALGRLAGGIAHDFNNLLTAIKGHTELLLTGRSDAGDDHEDLVEIDKAADRAANLTRQLLAFSRKQVVAPQILDLNAVITSMERMLRRLIGEDIELHTELTAGLDHIEADPGQIEQLVVNLVVNARDAMPNGGRVTVSTQRVPPAGEGSRAVELGPDGYVVLVVTDTGSGIDESTLAHIFDPFYTTKEQGRGTGLGLATVHGMVQQSGGHILVHTAIGAGTTFEVYLPASPEEAAPAPPPVAAPDLAVGGTILLVEDEPAVRRLVRKLLERQGHCVLEADDVDDAMRIARDHAAGIDLLLTDVVMPSMNGRELAELVSAERPSIRVLYMSGYTEDATLKRGVRQSGIDFLEKPFTLHALGHKVAEVLQQPRR